MNRFCAPGKGDKISCFSKKSLIKIAENWNKKNKTKINLELSKDELWQQLNHNFKNIIKCPQEWCWLDTKYVKETKDEEILYNTFRHKRPIEWEKNKTAWLSTTNISDVLEQYKFKYKDFEFIGPVPIDFDSKLDNTGICVVDELCKFNLENLLKNGKKKIGIVFNLDSHDKRGSHWVSMYSDFDKGGIYYFDSYGFEPCEKIHELLKRIHEQGNTAVLNNIISLTDEHSDIFKIKKIGKNSVKLKNNIFLKNDIVATFFGDKKYDFIINKVLDVKNNILILEKPVKSFHNYIINLGFKIFFNKVRHQYKASECGTFCIFYITEFLSGKSFEEISKDEITDDRVFKCRYIFYRPNSKEDIDNGTSDRIEDFLKKF